MSTWCRARGREVTGLMAMTTAWALAEAWYGDRLSPDWTRPGAPAIRELFDRLGLTGTAWQLA